MLDDLKNKISVLQSFDAEFELEKIIQDKSDILVGLQKSQWAQGIDRNDEATKLDGRDYYSVFTYNYKNLNGSGLGAVTDYITGYMSGDLYQNTSLSIKDKEVVFSSSVSYWTELVDRTGDQWPGLTADNRLSFAEKQVTPVIKMVFKERMGF